MTRPPPKTHPPYTRQHTAADPSNVVTETQVPNEAKALPSNKGPALILAFAGAGLALLAVICEWLQLDLVALILAIVAVVMTIVSVIMARNDQRTGMGAPIMCLIAAGVVLTVVLLDVFEADDAVENVREDLREDTREQIEQNRGTETGSDLDAGDGPRDLEPPTN